MNITRVQNQPKFGIKNNVSQRNSLQMSVPLRHDTVNFSGTASFVTSEEKILITAIKEKSSRLEKMKKSKIGERSFVLGGKGVNQKGGVWVKENLRFPQYSDLQQELFLGLVNKFSKVVFHDKHSDAYHICTLPKFNVAVLAKFNEIDNQVEDEKAPFRLAWARESDFDKKIEYYEDIRKVEKIGVRKLLNGMGISHKVVMGKDVV